ncbi:methyl-accepting chemotaxis protein [Alkalihalobacterium bogoriense]|uniref:methyl-accepting chemotaxis protein n=1 Tax=Alkalihalobacterium bogoriense TaxID=246272 RepID=UPI00054F678F|nr:methyl-accepting chemotaxis protein [Alkalihalobacterium bogoriense]
MNLFRGIRGKIIIVTVLALLVPGLIQGIIMYNEMKVLNYTSITGTVDELKALDGSIEKVFREAEDLMTLTSQQEEVQHKNFAFPQATKQYTNMPVANDDNKTEFYISYFGEGSQNRFIKNLYMGTSDGELYLSPELPPEVNLNEYDPRERDWYIKAMENPNELVWTEPYIDAGSGDSTVTLAKTLANSQGEIIGVLAIDFELNEFAVLMRENIQQKTMVTLFLTFIVGICVIIWLVRTISKRMTILNEGLEKVGQGDLRTRIELKGNDEFAYLGNNFNTAITELQSLASEVSTNTTNVSEMTEELMKNINSFTTQSTEIGQAIEEIATGASTQALSAEENNRMVFELGSMVKQLLEDVNSSATLAIETRKLSKDGHENVEVLEKLSKEGTMKNQETLHAIELLQQKSAQIGAITDMITDLAAQTNLLALNASIEAARAGEHGKGFAVVADEVRKLAEQSASSATNIAGIVGEIQSEVQKSISSMGKLKETIETQNESVNDTKASFAQISKAVQNTTEKTENIAQYIKEIELKKDGMLASIEDMSAISEETSASTEQVSATADEQIKSIQQLLDLANNLQQSSETLQQRINEFKL